MSEANLDVIRSLHRAYGRGDLERVGAYLSAGVTWRAASSSRDWDCNDREHAAFYQRVKIEGGAIVDIQDYGTREAALAGVVPPD